MLAEALVFTAPRSIELRKRTVPNISADQLLIRVQAVGVCHGDVAQFFDDDGPFPSWAGHEAVGTVEQVGENVTVARPGDRVALLGQERFASHTVASSHEVAVIHGDVTEWSRCVAEPLACCVSAVRLAAPAPGDLAAVVGCGFMGLGIIQALRHQPVGHIAAFARRQESLTRAARAGANSGTLAGDPAAMDQLRADLVPTRLPQQYLGPAVPAGPFDLVFEASGTRSGLRTATALTRIGGTLVMFGHQEGDVEIPGTEWHMKGLRVLNASPMGSPDFYDDFYRTVALMDAGQLSLEGLISHVSSAQDAQALFEAAADPSYVKGVVTFG